MKKTLIYAAAILLIGTYAAIAAAGCDLSRTDDAYRLFYVTGELRRYVSQDDLTRYTPDTVFEYAWDGNYLNQGQGWDYAEEGATWMLGDRADLFVYVEDPAPAYELLIDAADSVGYENRIQVNGRDAGVLEEEEGYLSALLSEPLRPGVNRISIVADGEVLPYCEIDPESEDSRELNLYVHTVELWSVEPDDLIDAE